MGELNFEVRQSAGVIECNFKELKEALAVQMSAYDGVTVTEDTIPTYKGELATLRKIRTAVENKRKDIKKTYLEPYEAFEENVKSLLEEIDKPIDLINTQLKMFEEDRKIAKRERVTKMYIEQVGDLIRFLPVEANFNEKWLNKSTSDSDIEFDISEKIVKVKNDLDVIHSLNSEIEEDVISAYEKSGNNLTSAIARNQQYLSDKAVLEEKARNTTESEKEPENDPVNVTVNNPVNPLEGTLLNDFVEQAKTVKIVISADDLQKVQNILDFSDIKYQILE